MDDLDLARRLKQLRRTVLMLQTELRNEHLDQELIADIETQMEQGVAMEPRSVKLRDHVDNIRENILIPRPELFSDTIKACDRLADEIQAILDQLG